MENEQTAVEWLEDEVSKLNSAVINMELTPAEYHKQRVKLWEQAKAMEKKELERVANKARDDGWRDAKYGSQRW